MPGLTNQPALLRPGQENRQPRARALPDANERCQRLRHAAQCRVPACAPPNPSLPRPPQAAPRHTHGTASLPSPVAGLHGLSTSLSANEPGGQLISAAAPIPQAGIYFLKNFPAGQVSRDRLELASPSTGWKSDCCLLTGRAYSSAKLVLSTRELTHCLQSVNNP